MKQLPAVSLAAAIAAAPLAAPLAAQEPGFSMEATDMCLVRVMEEGGDMRSCAGASAGRCIEALAPPRSATAADSCYRLELAAWQARLDDAYRQILEDAAARDREMEQRGLRAVPQVGIARRMQERWSEYRDAKCAYLFSTWEGHADGAPALGECLMRETAGQALFLQDFLQEAP